MLPCLGYRCSSVVAGTGSGAALVDLKSSSLVGYSLAQPFRHDRSAASLHRFVRSTVDQSAAVRRSNPVKFLVRFSCHSSVSIDGRFSKPSLEIICGTNGPAAYLLFRTVVSRCATAGRQRLSILNHLHRRQLICNRECRRRLLCICDW